MSFVIPHSVGTWKGQMPLRIRMVESVLRRTGQSKDKRFKNSLLFFTHTQMYTHIHVCMYPWMYFGFEIWFCNLIVHHDEHYLLDDLVGKEATFSSAVHTELE